MIDTETIALALPQDLQSMFYLWCMSEILGEKPKGVLYDVTRRPATRWGKKDDLASFLGRTQAAVTKPKEPDYYFKRIEMAVTWSEITTWKTDVLDPIMLDIRAWWEGTIPHYMSPTALTGKYGRCFMFDGITRGDFSSYHKKTVPFNELEGDI